MTGKTTCRWLACGGVGLVMAWAAAGAVWAAGRQESGRPEARPTCRVLLITGEDYKGHRWRQTAPVLERQIEKDNRLCVEVLDDLSKLAGVDLQRYAAVVMHFKNYDPKVPGRAGFDRLDRYVRQGGGLVLVHFACGAFQEFSADFEKLAGRVWNPQMRPHDPYGRFRVEIVDADHPVTRGMKSFETTDELYTCLDGKGPIRVLAEAVSKVDGKRYPMAFVLKVGRGRVFHCVLGHDAAALSGEAVGRLYRRGTAWAAGLEPAEVAGRQEQQAGAEHPAAPVRPWRFVSIPDFLNVDTTWPQPGWEPALDYVLEAIKAERPDFVLVPGDLVMGRWWTEAEIEKYAAIYYPAWVARMNRHGLKFYAALGDHDIGDNPWPANKAALVPLFKLKFAQYLGMPRNGPAGMKGTAFYVEHKGTLVVAVDVFEKADGPQGAINPQVSGEQLAWLKQVLADHRQARHVVVMGHVPILGPVRAWSSSRLMLTGGRHSPLWEAMKQAGVDLYLCGEVHAMTCTQRDGLWQVAHGGLFGYNSRVNYLVVTVWPDRLDLALKELDVEISGDKLWQVGANRPLETVKVSTAMRRRGFVTVGALTIDKRGGGKRFVQPRGYFEKRYEPAGPEIYRPFGRSAPPRLPALDDARGALPPNLMHDSLEHTEETSP